MSDQRSAVTEDAFAHLMMLAGRERPDFVTIEQGAPAMKTRFYAEEAAAAILAAGGAVAADIWKLRSNQGQSVTVSTREAAAALRSYTFMRFDDPAQAPPTRIPPGTPGARPADLGGGLRAVASGVMRTKDERWIFLHPSFPESTRRLQAVVGNPKTREEAVAAVAQWNALDLETAIAEARACAGIARTPEEWDASEQGRVLAGRPVVEITKIADSPPEPFWKGPFAKEGDMPLSGVRALDLTRVLAGPTCARTLAQYGAEVLYLASPNLPASTNFLPDTNHGKISAWCDLDTEDGKAALRALVKQADVFSQGYRAGALDKRGFSPLALAEMRPGIICTAINAYGHEGPWRHRAGWEQLAQTVTGMSYLHGQHIGAEEPTLQPGAVTDYGTGLMAAFGTLVALHRRALYGGSYMVRVSLSQTSMWIRKLGVQDEARLDATVAPHADEVKSWLIRTENGGWGPMSHLRPAVRLSATPARWKRPVVKLGAHEAAFPAPGAEPKPAKALTPA
jgi:crotonobetainyl-CoA:carnitine CoA-transferase CaiB-like acyl-CoA transferase